jgi:hypothetical protein
MDDAEVAARALRAWTGNPVPYTAEERAVMDRREAAWALDRQRQYAIETAEWPLRMWERELDAGRITALVVEQEIGEPLRCSWKVGPGETLRPRTNVGM